MSVFVDSAVFYAHHDRNAPRHDEAKSAFQRLLTGRLGTPFTSDYVYDETVTLMRSRTGRYADAKAVGDRIRGQGSYTDAVRFLHVDRPVFDRAVEVFDRYDDHPLSFTDATTVALVEHREIDCVLSFDDDFEGLVERVDPGELAS